MANVIKWLLVIFVLIPLAIFFYLIGSLLPKIINYVNSIMVTQPSTKADQHGKTNKQ